MAVCSQCGAPLDPAAAHCGTCGARVGALLPGGTLLGISSASPPAPQSPERHSTPPVSRLTPEGPIAAGGTLLGVVAVKPQHAPSQDAKPMSSNKDSIDPPFDADHTAPLGSPPPAFEDGATAAVDHDQTVAHGSAKPPLLVGGAPESVDTQVSSAEPRDPAEQNPGVQSTASDSTERPTITGDAELDSWQLDDTPSPSSEDPAWGSAGIHRSPQKRHHTRSSAILLLATSAALLLGLAIFHIGWTPPTPVTAQVVANGRGEVLSLSCGNCPDGTLATWQGQTVSFASQRAQLETSSPLQVGDNIIHLALDRPGWGRDEEMDIALPIRFRLTGDLKELNSVPPRVVIRVAALPQSQVRVNGAPIELNGGSGQYYVDIKPLLSGRGEQLVRAIPYSVTSPGAAAESGTLELRLNVTPLVLDTPGEQLVTDREHFTLAGRTAAGSQVRVADTEIAVDAEGRFAQLMSIDAIGEAEMEVVAMSRNAAPRYATLKVKRVTSLTREARTFGQGAVSDYTKLTRLGSDSSKATSAVALSGTVKAVKDNHHQSQSLMEVGPVGCQHPPCFVRVRHGSQHRFDEGTRVTAYGFTSAERSERPDVPVIDALYLLPASE